MPVGGDGEGKTGLDVLGDVTWRGGHMWISRRWEFSGEGNREPTRKKATMCFVSNSLPLWFHRYSVKRTWCHWISCGGHMGLSFLLCHCGWRRSVLAIYCFVTNNHQCSNLKQYHSLPQSSVGQKFKRAHLSSLLWVSQI